MVEPEGQELRVCVKTLLLVDGRENRLKKKAIPTTTFFSYLASSIASSLFLSSQS